jgi:hypothetical protein
VREFLSLSLEKAVQSRSKRDIPLIGFAIDVSAVNDSQTLWGKSKK